MALSRFGTLSGLAGTHSFRSADVYPDTQTLSFYKDELLERLHRLPVGGGGGQPGGERDLPTLQTPTAAQEALLNTYDTAGSIPFLDIANKYVDHGCELFASGAQGPDPGPDRQRPEQSLERGGQAIDGTANDITAAICNVTGNEPSSVCDSPAIAAIAKKLAA